LATWRPRATPASWRRDSTRSALGTRSTLRLRTWEKLEFGSVQKFAAVVRPYAYFAKDVWVEPVKLYQKARAVGLASTVDSFDVGMCQKLADPKCEDTPLPAARSACRAAIAKLDELEGDHQRRANDVAAALIHPVTHLAMLRMIEPLDVRAGER
jgi:hypothetical protein